MKIVLAILMLSSVFAFADYPPEACDRDYKITCACAPIGQFEGFQLYLVEKCLTEENWHLMDKRQYEKETCEMAMARNAVCRWLNGGGLF